MPEENIVPTVEPTPPTSPEPVAPTPVVTPVPTNLIPEVKKSSNMWLWLVLIFIVIAVLGVGGYYLLLGKAQAPSSETAVTSTPTATSTPVATASAASIASSDAVPRNWKNYTSKSYAFSINYPSNWETYTYATKPGDPDLLTWDERYFRNVGEQSPVVTIERMNNQNTSLNVILGAVRSWGYKEEQITVNNLKMAKFMGSSTGVPQIVMVFEKGGNIYRIIGSKDITTAEQVIYTLKFSN